jgi:hypothetical protein
MYATVIRLAIPLQISKFRNLGNPNTLWHAPCTSFKREAFPMSGMRSLNGTSNSNLSSLERCRSSSLEIDSRMPGKIQAISQAELLNLGPRNSPELGSGHVIRSGDASWFSI